MTIQDEFRRADGHISKPNKTTAAFLSTILKGLKIKPEMIKEEK